MASGGDLSKNDTFPSSTVEYITSFTRIDGNDSEEDKAGAAAAAGTEETGKSGKKKKDDKRKGHHRSRKKKEDKDKDKEDKGQQHQQQQEDQIQTVPRIPASKSTFAQISKELKARKIAAAQAAMKARKSKKNKGARREQECYTDKDRAAAVNLGSKDIKQSLKMKKRQDRSHTLQIPEEAEPSTLLALGNNELRSGDSKIALNFFNKAIELSPGDKNALVARSKCYLLLGEPQLALHDAESALQSDKSFIRAIYQKAEALYHLGDFEHSLMYYHRGHRLRPELEIFRLGVQKAQEAIENTIGIESNMKKSKKPESDKENEKERRRSKSAAPAVRRNSRHLLGELSADRLYLENLLQHPDIICSNQEASHVIIAQAEEGIAFLKSRQEFWRQQKPTLAMKKEQN